MKKIKSVFDGEEFCNYTLLCSTEKHGLNIHMHVVFSLKVNTESFLSSASTLCLLTDAILQDYAPGCFFYQPSV